MSLLDKHKENIDALCVKHKVLRLYVFGSFLTERFTDQSDIDFLVQFENIDLSRYADNYYDLKFGLQQLLQHTIDLVEEQAIRNPYFKQSISAHQQLLYAA
jgi:predicted nucleotidyltransferase